MTSRALFDSVRSKAFTPGLRDARALAAGIGDVDRDVARDVVRALVRSGSPALAVALEALPTSSDSARARLVDVVGRLADGSDVGAIELLADSVASSDPRCAKVAARALGRLGGQGALSEELRATAERKLLGALSSVSRDDLRATLVEALGKVGSTDARAAIGAIAPAGQAEARVAKRAQLVLARIDARLGAGRIDPSRAAATPTLVRLHCRVGLETVLLDETATLLRARQKGRGFVEGLLAGTLLGALAARVATHVSIPLIDRALRNDEPLDAAIAGELASARARATLAAFTEGPVRYRLAWASGGHKRALVFAVADRVSRLAPDLVNDPRDAPWQVVVDASRGRLAIALEPNVSPDPRFSYRVAEVPAASHPTIAAALALVAGVREDDVVWDPFVGSGLELVERARLGPYARMFGTDVSPAALEAARANLASARVERVTLERQDALSARMSDLSLVISNPPMGRRVVSGEPLSNLLVPLVEKAARALGPQGRMVWLTPSPRTTDPVAERAGLRLERSVEVDMGGFSAWLQRLERSSPGRMRRMR